MMFGTTPTTVRHSPDVLRARSTRRRLPSGSSPGQNVAAKLSFTIATGGRRRTIAVVEVAAGDRGGAHHAEVVRPGPQELHPTLAVRRAGPSFDLERPHAGEPAPGWCWPRTPSLDSRNGLQSRFQPVEIARAASRGRVACRMADAASRPGCARDRGRRSRRRQSSRSSAPGRPPRRAARWPAPSDQPPGPPPGASPRRPCVTPRASPFSAPLTPSCTTLADRRQGDQHRRGDGDRHQIAERAGVHRVVEHLVAGRGDRRPTCARSSCVIHQPSAPATAASMRLSKSIWRIIRAWPRAERHPGRELAPPSDGSHQREIGQIGAGDQQHEPRRRPQRAPDDRRIRGRCSSPSAWPPSGRHRDWSPDRPTSRRRLIVSSSARASCQRYAVPQSPDHREASGREAPSAAVPRCGPPASRGRHPPASESRNARASRRRSWRARR